jgi:predicted TIM-barrel fold metal-dependent hydrolase
LTTANKRLRCRQAVEETGIIASFHLILSSVMMQSLNEDPAAIFETTKGFITQFLDPFVGLLGRGVLERHPRVRLVLAESGLGWLPWVVQEMDYRYRRLVSNREYWNQRGGIGLSRPPSEVLRRQVYVTFQDDQVGLDLLKYFGEDKVMWASDDWCSGETASPLILLLQHGQSPHAGRSCPERSPQ